MTVERAIRALAGFFVMASVALGYWVHPGFFLFTAFVGANLFQSAFTNTCPAMSPRKRENAMKFRLTARSISSIAISIMITLRRFRKIPAMLMANRIAPSTR